MKKKEDCSVAKLKSHDYFAPFISEIILFY
jgi:hypothetical protein